MSEWNYWKDKPYYQKELKERALGHLPEMEAAGYISELVASEYQPGDTILDAGCGTGHFILSLRKHIRDLHYTGVDITPQHIHDAREIFAGTGPTFLEGDVQKLPFQDNSFDITICSNTIPHIPSAFDAIRELQRVTRKVLFIRMLIGNETLITKKALDLRLDENGEPSSFMYVNIYSEELIRTVFGTSLEILNDRFDEGKINAHFERHQTSAGTHIASRAINGIQFKGYLMLPWKILKFQK